MGNIYSTVWFCVSGTPQHSKWERWLWSLFLSFNWLFKLSCSPYVVVGVFFFNLVVNYSTLHQQASIRYKGNIWNAKSLAKPGNYWDLCQVINVGVFACYIGIVVWEGYFKLRSDDLYLGEQYADQWRVKLLARIRTANMPTLPSTPFVRLEWITFLSCKHHFNCYASQVQGWVPVSMAPVLT